MRMIMSAGEAAFIEVILTRLRLRMPNMVLVCLICSWARSDWQAPSWAYIIMCLVHCKTFHLDDMRSRLSCISAIGHDE